MSLDLDMIILVLATISPFLLALLGGVGWLYRHEKERREAVERQLSEHKYKAYIALLEVFFEVMKKTTLGKKIDQKEINDRMIDASKDLIIYGSDEVIETYQRWQHKARKNEPGALTEFAEIIISIRRDMGHSKTRITSENVLRQLITDYDDAKAKGIL